MKDRPYKDIGSRLRKIRGDETQKNCAKLLGIPQSQYNRYETGKNKPPLYILEKIEKRGNASIDWILTGKYSLLTTDEEIKANLSEISSLMGRALTKKEKDFTRDIFATFSQLMKIKKQGKDVKILTEKYDIDIFKQLERIYIEGNAKKIIVIEEILKSLDPGEKKVSSSSKKATKK